MPIRAIAGATSIHAFECADADWEKLKQTYKQVALTMPCCSRAAIPKTSKLGNFFFAHAQRGDCASASESPEHLYLKGLVAKAASAAGWTVTTEWPGQTPDGRQWTADVFCEKGNLKIALEIQMSHQVAARLIERQHIYCESGVHAAWFASAAAFNDRYLPPRKEVPFFRVESVNVGAEPVMHEFPLTVAEFVAALLGGRVTWQADPWVYQMRYLNDICWKCGGNVRQVYGYSIDVYGDAAKTVPNMSTVLEGFASFITNGELRGLGLNTVGRFERLKGNAPGFPFCNQCILCGAPQNNARVMQKLGEAMQRRDKSVLGWLDFISERESTGSWRYRPAT